MSELQSLRDLHATLQEVVASGNVFAFLGSCGNIRYVHRARIRREQYENALTLEELREIHEAEYRQVAAGCN